MSAPDERPAPWQQWMAARPDLDLSPMTIVGLLKHANAMLELQMEPVYETASISSSEFDVLFHLRHAEPTIARRLAMAMGRSPAALSKALAKLERRGLVTRESNPADRRAVFVSITPVGAAAVDDVLPRRLAIEREVLADIDDVRRGEVEEALGLLARVVEARALRGRGPSWPG